MDSLVLRFIAGPALALLAVSALADEAALQFKQLSGPPSDFALMRAPDPVEAAIHSKSALLPIETYIDKDGRRRWSEPLPVEARELRFALISGQPGEWSIKLRSPDGELKSAPALAGERRQIAFGIENASLPVDYYAIGELQPGLWNFELEASAKASGRGFVLLEGDPNTRLMSWFEGRAQWVGEPLAVHASLEFDPQWARSAAALGAAGVVTAATLRLTTPSGLSHELDMLAGKQGAQRQVSAPFVPTEPGLYLAQVRVEGVSRLGVPLVRTAEHVIPVAASGLVLGAERAVAELSEDQRYAIRLDLGGAKSGQHYRAYAEVWGRDANGRELPVAWVGGMVLPQNGTIELALDQRWVLLAGARAPFQLRNLRIEDPDHYIPLARAERLALSLPEPTLKMARADIVIDEAMLMGPRPAELREIKNTGRRLLLVHGYCSGGVWPAAQFSNASTFLDVNQNRTHDQFAQRIRNFGSQWNSFGVVAHSQGGAASLHLYTYYWSGLDNASGGRLIQSVGTPYQGTNLAGILAALGNWFGVGCGTNNDLTYSGAANWLAGIPSWARQRVNYYTTSFATAWWRWDYCNAATDIVLSDPEDGTVERDRGQLPGGINRGHVTGQCHTNNMRDPAQFLDASRNAVMNANAAR